KSTETDNHWRRSPPQTHLGYPRPLNTPFIYQKHKSKAVHTFLSETRIAERRGFTTIGSLGCVAAGGISSGNCPSLDLEALDQRTRTDVYKLSPTKPCGRGNYILAHSRGQWTRECIFAHSRVQCVRDYLNEMQSLVHSTRDSYKKVSLGLCLREH
ncbi:hypothetical protein PIB30_060014, partial [Stylosanthes scabra]|nr:hypothetical protein [Stylosanthes scabra]